MLRSDRVPSTALGLACLGLVTAALVHAAEPPAVQPRPHGQRVAVPIEALRIDDGDTLKIVWAEGDEEIVRILGIDTPETRHDEHDIPYDQPFGREATAFARGVLAMAEKVELLRAATVDPYGRTLAYVYVNGKNFSAIILRAGLAAESISAFGDNGFPEQAAECLQAAKAAGPVPFEPPHQFRKRMRAVAERMRAEGLLPPKPPTE